MHNWFLRWYRCLQNRGLRYANVRDYVVSSTRDCILCSFRMCLTGRETDISVARCLQKGRSEMLHTSHAGRLATSSKDVAGSQLGLMQRRPKNTAKKIPSCHTLETDFPYKESANRAYCIDWLKTFRYNLSQRYTYLSGYLSAYEATKKPPKLWPSKTIFSIFKASLHCSMESTNCSSARSGLRLNLGRLLRPKPSKSNAYRVRVLLSGSRLFAWNLEVVWLSKEIMFKKQARWLGCAKVKTCKEL